MSELRLAVGTPLQARTPGDVIPFARLAQATKNARMWFGHSGLIDSQALIAYFIGRGIDISYGSCVALTPLQHPYHAALTARSIAVLSGRPYVAGFGPATPQLVTAVRGAPYPSPKTAAVEFATVVRGLTRPGKPVEFHGEYFVQCGLPPFEPGPPVEVGLGVLRPAMARAAGAVADVAITWLTSPSFVGDTLAPALQSGADDAGRPRRPRIVTLVQIAVRRPGRDPAELAHLVAGRHMTGDHYRDMLRRSGVPVSGDDSVADGRLLVDHGIFLYGSPEEIARGLAAYHARGVDEVVLKTTGVYVSEGLRPAVDDLLAVLDAAGHIAPASPADMPPTADTRPLPAGASP